MHSVKERLCRIDQVWSCFCRSWTVSLCLLWIFISSKENQSIVTEGQGRRSRTGSPSDLALSGSVPLDRLHTCLTPLLSLHAHTSDPNNTHCVVYIRTKPARLCRVGVGWVMWPSHSTTHLHLDWCAALMSGADVALYWLLLLLDFSWSTDDVTYTPTETSEYIRLDSSSEIYSVRL